MKINTLFLILFLLLTGFVFFYSSKGETYICPVCGYSRTYFGLYKITTPKNTCPTDNIGLKRQ